MVSLRSDYRDVSGVLQDGELNAAFVKIVAIRRYKTFLEMAKIENYKLVIPSDASAESAAEVYNKYYSSDDQGKHGVLAIEIVPLTDPELAELTI